MEGFRPLSSLASTVRKIGGALNHMAMLCSYSYWRPDARQFRMARDDWQHISAHMRLLLHEIDDVFERQGGDAKHIQRDLRAYSDTSRQVKRISKKLDVLNQRLRGIRKDL